MTFFETGVKEGKLGLRHLYIQCYNLFCCRILWKQNYLRMQGALISYLNKNLEEYIFI